MHERRQRSRPSPPSPVSPPLCRESPPLGSPLPSCLPPSGVLPRRVRGGTARTRGEGETASGDGWGVGRDRQTDRERVSRDEEEDAEEGKTRAHLDVQLHEWVAAWQGAVVLHLLDARRPMVQLLGEEAGVEFAPPRPELHLVVDLRGFCGFERGPGQTGSLESVCEGSGQVVDDAGNGRVGRVGNRYGGVDDAGNDWCPLSRNVRGLLESVYEGSGQGNGRVGRVDRYDCYDDDGR